MYNYIIKTDQERKVVYSMMLSSILPLLDSSIINVVLPNISKDIDTSYVHVQWAVTAYLLSCSAGILLSPFISKNFGIKSSWFYSMLIFAISSIFIGFSNNFSTLIISRCIQGIGAGVLMPVCQSILAIIFEKSRLKQVMALIAIPAVFAPAVGPLLGAVLSERISWRMAFFINVPIVLISFFIGNKVVPANQKHYTRMNYVVFLMFFISIVMMFASIGNIFSNEGIDNRYAMMMFTSIILLIASVILNNRTENKVINLSQFSRERYSLAILMCFLTSIIFFQFFDFLSLRKINGAKYLYHICGNNACTTR